MPLYKIERRGEVSYDEMAGAVVRAPNPQHALQIVAANAKDEGRGAWEESLVTITTLTGSGKPELVLRDFRAG